MVRSCLLPFLTQKEDSSPNEWYGQQETGCSTITLCSLSFKKERKQVKKKESYLTFTPTRAPEFFKRRKVSESE